ncbi:MAG: polysaccharide biosynthesis C-terminal domain-containing protein [Candidatus Bathyarchaeia archaeon]
MKMVLMFAVPMFLGAVILSKDLLSILNPAYSVASPILIILALSSLFLSISSIFESIIIGTEDFDAAARLSFRRALKSRIFLLLTLPYIQAAIVLPPIYLVLSSFPLDSILLTLYFALIGCIGQTIMTLTKFFIAKKSIRLIIPWKSLGKYVCSSLAMSMCLLALPTPPRLIIILSKILIGAIIYFVILFAIDKEVRKMIRLAMRETTKYLRKKK